MNYIVLPHKPAPTTTKHVVSDAIVLATTTGSVKSTNEDFVGYRQISSVDVFAIADGHWGGTAARMAVEHLLALSPQQYLDNERLRRSIDDLQATLYSAFVTDTIDPNTTKTPETSLLLGIIDRTSHTLRIVGYGDCRALMIRDDTVLYEYTTRPTWLGVFSQLEYRDRLSVVKGLTIDTVPFKPHDMIITYTDGIDESVYEVPTTDIAAFAAKRRYSPEGLVDALFERVFETGAEDNATVIVAEL